MSYLRKIISVMLAALMLLSVTSAASFVRAEEQMSDEFKSILTDGKFVFNYAKPKSKTDWMAEIACASFEDMTGNFYLHDDNGVPALSDDLTKITISRGEETHTVDVVWNYDETAFAFAEKISKAILESDIPTKGIYLTDLEYINYLVNTASMPIEFDEMANYSGEFKAITGNTNFSLKMQTLAGGGNNEFSDSRFGITRLYYRDTVYCVWESEVTVRANRVIYAPSNTANTVDALVAAAQKRIDDYIGENVIKITDSGSTVAEYYENEIAVFDNQIADARRKLSEKKSALDAEQAKAPELIDYNLIAQLNVEISGFENDISWYEYQKECVVKDYNNGEYKDEHLRKAEGGYIFNLSVNGHEGEYKFVIVKDDSKLAPPTYESIDISTNVSASTDSSEVPLDAVIRVDRITHGEEHERIIGVLEITDGEMFDIKIHSGSIDDYISKLKNGKFKVQIPIPKEYKGKELTVYYVDANGKVTEYHVTVKNGFAAFETDHFSIYTLVAKANAEAPKQTTTTTVTTTPETTVPETTPNETTAPETTPNETTAPDSTDPETTTTDDKEITNPPDTSVPETTERNEKDKDEKNNTALWIALGAVAVVAASVAVIVIVKKKKA